MNVKTSAAAKVNRTIASEIVGGKGIPGKDEEHSKLNVIDRSRRTVVAFAVVAAGAAALSSRRTWAAPDADPAGPHLDPQDPAAAAVGYVEDAARAQAAKSPGFIAGSNCENCLQLQGRAGDAYRPCSIFPGKLVSAAGWCRSWTPEI